MRINVKRILTAAAAAVLTVGQVCPALAYGPGDYYYRGGPGVDPYYNENSYYSGGPGVGEGNARETSGDTIYAYPGWNTNVPDTTQYTYDPWDWWNDDDDDWDDDDWWYYNNGPGVFTARAGATAPADGGSSSTAAAGCPMAGR